MITRILKGDIFESPSQTITNTVNCVGIMGKGLALEFKKRYPEMFEDYLARCRKGEVLLGHPYLYRALVGHWVLNFPTKGDWRALSRIEDIRSGLGFLRDNYQEWGITSLAMPALGCANGQLSWNDVGPLLYEYLNEIDIPVEIYGPLNATADQLTVEFLSRKAAPSSTETFSFNPAWVALMHIVERISKEPHHWPIGRTTFHKIAYFSTELGLPTGLEFSRSSYGPFAPNLKPLMTHLGNLGLLEERTRNRTQQVHPGKNLKRAMSDVGQMPHEWQIIVDKVTDLFLRVRFTSQAELLATVHFAARELDKRKVSGGQDISEIEVLGAVQEWKKRRNPPIEDVDIARTIRDLNVMNWIKAEASDDLPLPVEDLIFA